MDTYHRWLEIVIGGSLSGGPVVNVPAGFGPGGLPMGLQLSDAEGVDEGHGRRGARRHHCGCALGGGLRGTGALFGWGAEAGAGAAAGATSAGAVCTNCAAR